jgi:hypothetical protein
MRRLGNHLREVVDPQGAEERGRRRLERRRLWLSGGADGMLAIQGLLDAECGETLQAALLPLARPAGPDDERSASQRRADALGAVARHALQAGTLPHNGGLRPQVTVTVELASLRATGSQYPAGLGGAAAGAGAARRWLCGRGV